MNYKKFVSCGNIMLDTVEHDNGARTEIHIGGPSMFALAGIRLYTKECGLVCQGGSDHVDKYRDWMRANRLGCDYIRVSADHCTQHVLRHHTDGTYEWKSRYGQQLMGYLKTTPEHIDAATDDTTEGIYLAQNTDKVFWGKLNEVKRKKNFKIMWELELPHPDDGIAEDKLKRVMDVVPFADMWSLNVVEASYLFDIPRDDEHSIIKRIMDMPVELTLFRVGKKGAYAVTPSDAVFCESIDITASVDPTGCGNNSTGAAMYAHVSGHSPKEVVVMANIAAGYNAAQLGPYPKYSDEDMQNALRLLKECSTKI